MNPEIQAQWVAALRSGDYRQGDGTLRSPDDEFCCLGVLCDLAVKAGVEIAVREPNPNDYTGTNYRYDNDDAFLPDAVREWAGLSNPNPLIGHPDVARDTAAGANDNGVPFSTIADLIEQGVA